MKSKENGTSFKLVESLSHLSFKLLGSLLCYRLHSAQVRRWPVR